MQEQYNQNQPRWQEFAVKQAFLCSESLYWIIYLMNPGTP